jgi:hypothetical protein
MMTKHSLRGLFLGLSLVLLLSGGVALAQQTVSVEPYCAVCCDLTTTDFLDCFDQSPTYWLVRATGWEPFEKLRFTLTFPGYEHWMAITTAADSTGYYEGHLTFLCSDSQGPAHWRITMGSDWPGPRTGSTVSGSFERLARARARQ